MNTEQERADFEAWALKERIAYRDEKHGVCFYNGERNSYWIGYQAGRAALQSQDREDAERYRAWRKAAATNNGNFLRLVSNELPDWDEGPVDESRVDAAIDHARRIEGDGE